LIIFTLDYCDLKISILRLFATLWDHSISAAILQQFSDIVWWYCYEWQFKTYYHITLTFSISCVTFWVL